MFIQLLFAMGMEAEVMVMQEGAGERMLSSFLFWSANNLFFCLSLGEHFHCRVSWEARIKWD